MSDTSMTDCNTGRYFVDEEPAATEKLSKVLSTPSSSASGDCVITGITADKGKGKGKGKGIALWNRETVEFPQPLSDPERNKPNFKPEPFPENQNFKLMTAFKKAQYARLLCKDVTKIAFKHCPTKMWPNEILKGLYANVLEAEFRYNHMHAEFIDHLASIKADAEARKAKRMLEKKDAEDGMSEFKNAFNSAFKAAFTAKSEEFAESCDEDPDQMQQMQFFIAASNAAKEELATWALRINTWSPDSVMEVVKLAGSAMIGKKEANAILNAAVAIETEDGKNDTVSKTPNNKRKHGEGSPGLSSELVQSPVGPPPQQEAEHCVAKIPKKAAASDEEDSE